MKNKYNIWKTDPSGNPIEGTDVIVEASTLRLAIRWISNREGITIRQGSTSVRLPDGGGWYAQKIN